jgi:hypothetical protein
MIFRLRWTGIALLTMLAAASPCLAATDSTGAGPGRGGIGGLVGGSYMISSQDYSAGALSRFDFSGHWRYVFTPSWRIQIGPGFTWSGYRKEEPMPFTDIRHPEDTAKDGVLTLLVPVSAQVQYTIPKGAWIYHLGAGPGVYRVWVENRRDVLKDPTTFKLHRGLYLGGTAELGIERFLKALPSTSIEGQLASHFVFATRDDQFPNGFNSMLGNMALRVGANYYFSMNRKPAKQELPLPGGQR